MTARSFEIYSKRADGLPAFCKASIFSRLCKMKFPKSVSEMRQILADEIMAEEKILNAANAMSIPAKKGSNE